MQDEYSETTDANSGSTVDILTVSDDESTDAPALPSAQANGGTFSAAEESPTSGIGGSGASGSGATNTGTARGVAGQAQQAAAPIMDQAQQKTGEIIGQVQQQATSRLEQQKEHAASGLVAVAETLRQTGQQLRENEQGVVTQYAAQYGETAAQQVERISNYLSERDVSQLVHEVESFARREPAIFIGGAFLLGVIGARFLKSSAPPPQSQSYGQMRAGNTGNLTGETGSFYPLMRMRIEEE